MGWRPVSFMHWYDSGWGWGVWGREKLSCDEDCSKLCVGRRLDEAADTAECEILATANAACETIATACKIITRAAVCKIIAIAAAYKIIAFVVVAVAVVVVLVVVAVFVVATAVAVAGEGTDIFVTYAVATANILERSSCMCSARVTTSGYYTLESNLQHITCVSMIRNLVQLHPMP